ncbi:hypothetical protein DFJ74DRAFT_193671 [Hyaloraphidium curvatum]|nr:hypothetical protein DFJ74DRAFT_193671 [Hyaloraphidium curvatum]
MSSLRHVTTSCLPSQTMASVSVITTLPDRGSIIDGAKNVPADGKYAFPMVDLSAGIDQIAAVIKSNAGGALLLSNAGPAPFRAIEQLFARLDADPTLGERANKAYDVHPVVKDPRLRGTSSADVDEKRAIDLSPARLAQIAETDPGLEAEIGPCLGESLAFFEKASKDAAPKLVAALALASGAAYDPAELRFNYRMADYFIRPSDSPAPRCGKHRDFGPFTVIWQDGTGGLEVNVAGEWVPVPAGRTVLLFGICAGWRSNDRVLPAEHRVVSGEAAQGTEARRLSAVLFVGLESSAPLVPAVLPGETRRWVDGVVGEVHPRVRRKWQAREGTATEGELEEERKEREVFGTQEELLAALYKA